MGSTSDVVFSGLLSVFYSTIYSPITHLFELEMGQTNGRITALLTAPYGRGIMFSLFYAARQA